MRSLALLLLLVVFVAVVYLVSFTLRALRAAWRGLSTALVPTLYRRVRRSRAPVWFASFDSTAMSSLAPGTPPAVLVTTGGLVFLDGQLAVRSGPPLRRRYRLVRLGPRAATAGEEITLNDAPGRRRTHVLARGRSRFRSRDGLGTHQLDDRVRALVRIHRWSGLDESLAIAEVQLANASQLDGPPPSGDDLPGELVEATAEFIATVWTEATARGNESDRHLLDRFLDRSETILAIAGGEDTAGPSLAVRFVSRLLATCVELAPHLPTALLIPVVPTSFPEAADLFGEEELAALASPLPTPRYRPYVVETDAGTVDLANTTFDALPTSMDRLAHLGRRGVELRMVADLLSSDLGFTYLQRWRPEAATRRDRAELAMREIGRNDERWDSRNDDLTRLLARLLKEGDAGNPPDQSLAPNPLTRALQGGPARPISSSGDLDEDRPYLERARGILLALGQAVETANSLDDLRSRYLAPRLHAAHARWAGERGSPRSVHDLLPLLDPDAVDRIRRHHAPLVATLVQQHDDGPPETAELAAAIAAAHPERTGPATSDQVERSAVHVRRVLRLPPPPSRRAGFMGDLEPARGRSRLRSIGAPLRVGVTVVGGIIVLGFLVRACNELTPSPSPSAPSTASGREAAGLVDPWVPTVNEVDCAPTVALNATRPRIGQSGYPDNVALVLELPVPPNYARSEEAAREYLASFVPDGYPTALPLPPDPVLRYTSDPGGGPEPGRWSLRTAVMPTTWFCALEAYARDFEDAGLTRVADDGLPRLNTRRIQLVSTDYLVELEVLGGLFETWPGTVDIRVERQTGAEPAPPP